MKKKKSWVSPRIKWQKAPSFWHGQKTSRGCLCYFLSLKVSYIENRNKNSYRKYRKW